MTNELRTNDEPQRILLEASERIKACYPNGTRVEVRYPRGTVIGTVRYIGLRTHGTDGRPELFVIDSDLGEWPFSPAVNPHRVLP